MNLRYSIFILILSFFAFLSLTGQVEINTNDGFFLQLAPWSDGYLGVVQPNISTKSRQYQYFNLDGSLKWNVEMKPFNNNNANVCNREADYAYFINMPFASTATIEKISKTELLNVYQIDRSGKVVEKSIDYTGVLKPVEAYVKKMEQCYLGALKDGFIFICTNNNSKYHVVKVDSEFNVSYTSIDFEWNEELYVKNQLSQPKYILGENEFSMIQTKKVGSDLIATIKTFDINDLSKMVEVTNSMSFAGTNLFSIGGEDIDYSVKERVFTSYERVEWKGENIYYRPTLASFTNYVYTKNGLKMYARYRHMKEGNKNVLIEGFVIYDLNNSADTELEPINKFDFVGDDNNQGWKLNAFHMNQDSKFIFINYQSKNKTTLITSNGEEKKFDEKLPFIEAYLTYISGKTKSKLNIWDLVYIVDDKHVVIDFDDKRNQYGYSSKANIYLY